ncbi:MAG: bifunctional phosphoribosylaminoimidazolecarboxamide formyltransferase/IMP cyclohydrolase [Bacillota bacterium]|nr:bifunctional phosphoribosylaminoimidazolecarboxamide formyltransferase/IMP cyclohydrolase [Bacillota bacterium]
MNLRALISVSDKTGIVDFAKKLSELGVSIISTGGTEKTILDAGVDAINISRITEFPECLDGRVKTLHPSVHAGILAMRDNPSHMEQLEKLNIETIDIVAINLYPFKETISKSNVALEEAIENIDIGGPTMLRSAAKNHRDVLVIVDPADYDRVYEALKNNEVTYELRYDLALKVFEHTANYDAMIASYLREKADKDAFPSLLTLTYEKVEDMRYGENPHQKAAFYKEVLGTETTLAAAKQLHGKALSFNNINDANAAIALIKEFEKPTAVAVKHAAPCGVGVGYDILHAYAKAYGCDPQSIFGGVVALNRAVDLKTAEKLSEIFLEIVIAPEFEKDRPRLDMKKVLGGLLVQETDEVLTEGELKSVTERIPTKNEIEELMFAWKVCKHVKSNGIVITKDGQTLGLGQGQVSRVWAAEGAIAHSNYPTKGAVLASDAFFPFPDAIKAAAEAGISAIIQPGGSVKDQDIIDEANKYGIAMVFTGMRHFKH